MLRSQPQSEWHMKTVREVLLRSGVDMAALLERHEVITACQQQLDKLPRPLGMDLPHVTCCITQSQGSVLSTLNSGQLHQEHEFAATNDQDAFSLQ